MTNRTTLVALGTVLAAVVVARLFMFSTAAHAGVFGSDEPVHTVPRGEWTLEVTAADGLSGSSRFRVDALDREYPSIRVDVK